MKIVYRGQILKIKKIRDKNLIRIFGEGIVGVLPTKVTTFDVGKVYENN